MEFVVFKQRNKRGYEWGKGKATTQARLFNPQINCKGKATEFKEIKPEYLDSAPGRT